MLAVGGPAVVVLLIGAVSFSAFDTLRETRQLVAETRIVIEHAQRLLGAVVDAETAQRGYLLTGDRRYLAPFDLGVATIRRDSVNLRRLTTGNVEQQHRLDTLNRLIAARLDRLTEVTTVRRTEGVAAAIREVRDGQGLALMDSARQVVGRIQAEERELLTTHIAAEEARAARMRTLLIGGFAAAALLAMFINGMLAHLAARIAADEQSLAEQHALLEQQATELEVSNQQLQEQALELEMSNQQLQDQQMELEMANHQLQDQQAELEAQAEELQVTTEQLAASEAELRVSEQRLRAAFAHAATGVVLMRLDGRFIEANAAYHAITGHSMDELRNGLRHLDLVHPAERPASRALLEDLVQERTGSFVIETRYSRADGSDVHVRESVSLLRNASGAPESLVALVEDVSQRRRAELEREQLLVAESAARAEAEAANMAKAQFLTTMSHELRTPLNAIAGYADLLQMEIRGPVSAEQRDDLARIKRNGQHLLSLINDILNYAKLEAGRVEFRMARVCMSEAISGIEPLVAPQLAVKSLRYSVTCPEACVAYGDAEKLQQVLLNLLANAAKFTDPGGTISVSCWEEPGAVHVCVRDTGRGIPAEKLERIFDPFVQIDRHLTNASQQGVGLGLAISQELIRAMGGGITVESMQGVGSAFTVSLPRPGSTPGSSITAYSPPDRPTPESTLQQ